MYKVIYVFKKINKKRFIIVGLMVAISIGVFNFTNSKLLTKSESISANATPITNKVVVLDAGHRTA